MSFLEVVHHFAWLMVGELYETRSKRDFISQYAVGRKGALLYTVADDMVRFKIAEYAGYHIEKNKGKNQHTDIYVDRSSVFSYLILVICQNRISFNM